MRKAILSILLCIVLLWGSAGVYATWTYATAQAQDRDFALNLEVNDFQWQGSEDLPDDTEGEDHYSLIEAIIDGPYGLNTKGSYINEQIQTRSNLAFLNVSTLGSMDFWERQDIANYFDTTTQNLSFVLYFPEGVSDTYYLYTTNVSFGGSNEPNFPVGQKIYPIYRTKIVKNSESGKYEGVETKLGYANSAYYKNVITGTFLRYPSIDPESWREGVLGTGMDNPILTYIGQSTVCYPATATDKVYYKLSASRGTATVTLNTEANCSVRVYSANKQLVSATAGAQGSRTISWATSNNSTYYIEISGAESIPFTVS